MTTKPKPSDNLQRMSAAELVERYMFIHAGKVARLKPEHRESERKISNKTERS